MEVQLTPPVGTCYFKSYTAKLTGKDPTVTLTASFYVYATNATPDSKFTANGGKVYIIVVYDGLINSTAAFGYGFGLEDDSKLLSFKGQQPISGSGKTKGKYNIYTIDFTHTMSMYSNGGNDVTNFVAKYKKEFSLLGYRQYAGTAEHAWGWWLCMSSVHRNPPSINGLQVFEASELGVAKCTLFQNSVYPNHCNEIKFDLDFSAATMEKARVGDSKDEKKG